MLHQDQPRARIRSKGMMLRIILVLLAGVAAMILVNPSGTDFGDTPQGVPGDLPTVGELTPYLP